MERRIAAVIRWLERCLAACRTGAMESALMDVECARADLDRLREDVWTALERKHAPRARGFLLPAPLGGVLVALVIVLAAAAPLAPFQERRMPAEPMLSVEWVTPDEKMLLGNLRRRLSENNRPTASLPDRNEVENRTETQKRLAKRASVPSGRQDVKSDGGMPYDRLVELLQTGEKALKNERPVIKIER